jgi:hypothetical protein
MNLAKDYKDIVGNNLIKMRTALGISIRHMAKLMDNKVSYKSKLSDYETGKRCAPIHVIIKAMEVTEIPMEDLYDVMFDPNYKLPKRYKPYANGTNDYERFLTDRRIPKRA